MIHLYALARAGGDPGVTGIDAAPVVSVPAAGLHAIVSHHDEAVQTTADAALTHVTVIEVLAARADVLPVQFGPGHTDEATLRAELDRIRPQLHTLLERVAGHVEFVVRATEPPAPSTVGAGHDPAKAAAAGPGQGEGRAYLEARRAVLRAEAEREEALRDRLRSTTDALASAAAVVRDTTGRKGPERCFLVPRAAAPAFAAQARQLTEDAGDLVVGGPWPPFTFSSLPPAPQGDA